MGHVLIIITSKKCLVNEKVQQICEGIICTVFSIF